MTRRATTPPVPDADWAYFFDLDGTLVDFAPSPRGVRVSRSLRRFVQHLHDVTRGAVALITGRAIADVDRLFPDLRLAAAGQHGIERRRASGRITRHRVPAGELDDARRRLADAVGRHPALLLEDKGRSLALHYRAAPSLGGYAHKLARDIVVRLGTAYCVQSGKRVVEIRPAGKDKGEAIREFMRERPFAGRRPVFLGDDQTDEYGFAMINRLGGCSVKVGAGSTQARWRLRDVGAARAWLRRGRPAPRSTR